MPLPLDHRVHLASYADDTAILAESSNAVLLIKLMQDYLDHLEKFFENWLISVNSDKSSALLICRKRRPHVLPNLKLFDSDIPWKTDLKYLGVTFDKTLTFNKHIKNVSTRGRQVMAQMFPLLNKHSKLSPKNKLLLYKTIIRPTMLYACPAWGQAAKTNIQKIQITQNKALRLVFGAPWFVTNAILHHDAEIPTIPDYIHTLATTHFDSLALHPNPLMRDVIAYDPHVRMKTRRPKMILNPP